ncbi:hypothetical protein [Paenibacillus sinopodophylli]|uniref:hypothetical protein n=1 Tax=Paenibacillus sinopodophylli TaxID=1837342 RepID=UPI00110CC1D5|nr:hypothetical protein [Paenibacillus sinopodophylli]
MEGERYKRNKLRWGKALEANVGECITFAEIVDFKGRAFSDMLGIDIFGQTGKTVAGIVEQELDDG